MINSWHCLVYNSSHSPLSACGFTLTQVQCPAFYLYHWGRVQVCARFVIEVELADGNLYSHNLVAFNSVHTPKAWPKATSSTRRQVDGTACLCWAAPKPVGSYRGDSETSLIFMLASNSPQPRKIYWFYLQALFPLFSYYYLQPPKSKNIWQYHFLIRAI